MHQYWLGIAIRLCGPKRKYLGKLIGVSAKQIGYWLNSGNKIPLEYAIKIENTINGRVTRFQLAPYLDKSLKKQMMAEYEAAKSLRTPLTFSEKVALGLAIEAELGDRQGVRTDHLLREKFPEVKAVGGNFFSAGSVYQGRTEEIAAYYTQLGSYKSYQKAKKIVQFGVPELIQIMDGQYPLPVDRADKIARHFSEKQRYFLSLDRKQMIRELEADSNQAIQKATHPLPPVRTGYVLIMAWALLSFISMLKTENEECLL